MNFRPTGCCLWTIQIVVVAQNLPTSSVDYECRYTGARFSHTTAVIQVDELTDVGNTALKCETPLSQQLPQFNALHGRWSVGYCHSDARLASCVFLLEEIRRSLYVDKLDAKR